MFENLLARKTDRATGHLDVGSLAEALLFYQNIHLVLSPKTLSLLLKEIKPETFINLIKEKRMSASIQRDDIVVITNTKNNVSVHTFGGVQLTKSAQGTRRLDNAGYFEDQLRRLMGSDAPSRRVQKQILDLVPVRRINERGRSDLPISKLVYAEMGERPNITSIISTILQEIAPNFNAPKNFYFRMIQLDEGFFCDTNLNIKEIEGRLVFDHPNFSLPDLLCIGLDARADIQMACDKGAELLSSNLTYKLANQILVPLLQKTTENLRDLQAFQETYLSSAHAIAETINTGERTFDEFLKILEKATKFRQFLKAAHPDKTLMESYYEAAVSDTWVQRLPTKAWRFAIFGGASLASSLLLDPGAGAIAGLGLTASDYVIVDRLLKGWRPHHFVNRHLNPFVGG
jgi:hypothetical protein